MTEERDRAGAGETFVVSSEVTMCWGRPRQGGPSQIEGE